MLAVVWMQARSQDTLPWTVAQPGYKVEVVATNFQLPVNIAFVPHPLNLPNTPLFYVAELYGTIKVVTPDFQVRKYASGLLNFDPTGEFPGTGEQGLSGIVVDSATGDVFSCMLYNNHDSGDVHYPKVVRLHSQDGGMTAAVQTTVLDMVGQTQGQSHFVSNISFGPDGKLYVHMGDGGDTLAPLSVNSLLGKILRLNVDGSAPRDNPFFDSTAPPGAWRNYVYALGFRNAFGGAWRTSDGCHYAVENGVDTADRIVRVERGGSYGWDGTDSSLAVNALWSWGSDPAPVNIAIVQKSVFGGSGFPEEKMDHAYVTLSGDTYAGGPDPISKRIVEFEIAPGPDGKVISGPTDLLVYNGTGRATALGLAAGPDGLYFTDLYKDQNYSSPIDSGANVLRIRSTGGVSSVREKQAPVVFSLAQNYPNPFNPSTVIRYALPHRSHVSLTVFNTLGQKVADLVDGEVEAGYYDVRFDGSRLSSGVYFYRLTAGQFVQTRSFVLVK
jgi:hypothetical protein